MNEVDWSKAPDGAMRHSDTEGWLLNKDGNIKGIFSDAMWSSYVNQDFALNKWNNATPRPEATPTRVGVMSDGKEVTLVAANDSDYTPTDTRRYYIAGPITGHESTYRDVFNAVSNALGAQGYVVLNPATLPAGLTQGQYMDICTAMLRCVTHVKMLKGWERSEGARIEHALAIKSDLTVEYE